MAKRKTWREKLSDSKDLPKVEKIPKKMNLKWGHGVFVIPAPIEVDAIMRRVPEGRLITIAEIRSALARKHSVDMACPITTGIFAWIAAHAAEEEISAGAGRKITPYWRTLKTGGELNLKYPGGLTSLSRRLKQEGHRVLQKGKRYFVKDYEHSLFRPRK